MNIPAHIRCFSKLRVPLLLLGIAMLVSTVGFMIIERYNFIDAVYMTALTISTVGYEVVRPLSPAGKIFTVGSLLTNICLVTYFIAMITRYMVDGEFVKRYKQLKMENKIAHLKDHVIICGFGRNGKESAQILQINNIPFVVIESSENDDHEHNLAVEHYIHGNATKDEVLLQAGIKSAKAVISSLPVDADNLFLVLSARQLNPTIKIISRASVDSSVHKLKIAGADNVIMPDKIGGAHMATLVVQPDVTEILSIMATTSNVHFRIVELPVTKAVTLAELDLWKQTHCTVIGVKNTERHYSMNPPPERMLSAGDRLIIMGSEEQIQHAKRLL